MAARLTDREEKEIIALHAEGLSDRRIAKMCGCSPRTVANVLRRNPDESLQKCAEKRQQNTLEMLAFMDSRRGRAQEVVDMCLDYLADPEKLQGATLAQIATALGIVVDKFIRAEEERRTAGKEDEGVQIIDDL